MNASWVGKWQELRVVVLGDVMLDRFVYGRVERVSPEAPIPILHHLSEKEMLGGAGNVARNIGALGGQAVLVGALGDDREGDLIAGRLAKSDRICARFVRVRGQPTTTKVRFVSGAQQIMRLDVERQFELTTREVDALCESLDEARDVSAVILSDYAKGVVVPALVRRVIEIARARGIPIIVDPKSRNVERYAGATVITPNAAEATAVAGFDCTDDAQAERAARMICEQAQVDAVVLTRGPQGLTIFDSKATDGQVMHAPAHATEVFDVSGAGDTVIAALALGLAAGADVKTAAQLGNVAAGIAVGKRGTAVVRVRELLAAVTGGLRDDPKIVGHEAAKEIVADWKAHGLRIGFTNGCFDLLHPGHVELLKRSRAACDRLVVALNTDASVRRFKGGSRPVQNERARSIVMAAIESVDLVTLFDEDTPIKLIESLRPDYLIKGADYSIANVVGADFVCSYGGKVVLVPIEQGHSTTLIIARANAGAP